MTLSEIVREIDQLEEDAIICVRRPWSAGAEATITEPDENFAVPDAVKQSGCEYFLEVHVVREVLGVFGDRKSTEDEKVRLLIHYAENDAYPDWVYVP